MEDSLEEEEVEEDGSSERAGSMRRRRGKIQEDLLMYMDPSLQHRREFSEQGKLTTSTEANMTEDRGPRARWCRDMRKLAIGTCNEMNKEL